MNIFEYRDYKKYLEQVIANNAHIRGYKTRLAIAAHCQKPYISQVLGSKVHLTPEHALGLSQFWKLSEIETEYWLELVQLGRTGYGPLIKRIQKRLDSLQQEHEDFSKRFKEKSLDNLKIQGIYYSDWIFCAIHKLTEIEGMQAIDQISSRLHLPVETIVEYVSKLEQLGLLKKDGNKLLATERNIHLGKDSAFNLLAHQNWRIRALADIQNKKSDGLHYSAVQTLSLSDFIEIKSMILDFIDQKRKRVIASKSEEAACFTIDWFKI